MMLQFATALALRLLDRLRQCGADQFLYHRSASPRLQIKGSQLFLSYQARQTCNLHASLCSARCLHISAVIVAARNQLHHERGCAGVCLNDSPQCRPPAGRRGSTCHIERWLSSSQSLHGKWCRCAQPFGSSKPSTADSQLPQGFNKTVRKKPLTRH